MNKNAVPNDPRSPFVTSGLRLGTPAVTTRGFTVADCQQLAGMICDVLDNIGDTATEDRVRGLTSGGDDYMVKPFAVAELVARPAHHVLHLLLDELARLHLVLHGSCSGEGSQNI